MQVGAGSEVSECLAQAAIDKANMTKMILIVSPTFRVLRELSLRRHNHR